MSLASIGNAAHEEMKGRLDIAYCPAAAGGGRKVVGNRHLSFCYLYPSVPQKCQPQKLHLDLENTSPDQQGFYGHLQVSLAHLLSKRNDLCILILHTAPSNWATSQ